jgi:tetrahydromethanopterin S-methyltransferase subunit G
LFPRKNGRSEAGTGLGGGNGVAAKGSGSNGKVMLAPMEDEIEELKSRLDQLNQRLDAVGSTVVDIGTRTHQLVDELLRRVSDANPRHRPVSHRTKDV